MGGGQRKNKGSSLQKDRTISQMLNSDAGKKSSSGKQVLVNPEDLDEEISKKLFLKENPGLDLEMLEEEEARLKAAIDKSQSKSKASATAKKPPQAKGIVIKERTSDEASKAKSQVEYDPKFKGKGKVDELVRVYMPTMDEQIDVDEDTDLILKKKKDSQTTSDRAQVVQSQELVNSDATRKQATSDTAQVSLTSGDKGITSDIAHVKPSTTLPGFTQAK